MWLPQPIARGFLESRERLTYFQATHPSDLSSPLKCIRIEKASLAYQHTCSGITGHGYDQANVMSDTHPPYPASQRVL